MTDNSQPTETIGSYQVLEELSRSSRSRVVKALRPPSQRPVVVKVLPASESADPERVAAFHREIGALSRINDPNVTLVLDSGQEGDSLFLAMEFVPLVPLSRVLRRRRLDLAQSIGVFRNICLGLRSVHQQGVVHRNLNPTSILVSDELSMVKVAGFGSRADRSSHTHEMETMATGRLNVAFHYVAPELARGDDATEGSDIYSLGIILYEMLTGRVPMGRVGLPSRINTQLPAEVDRLVLDCLATRPEDRLASVDHVLQAVRTLEDRLRLGVVSEFTGLVRGTSRMVRGRSGAVIAIGAAAAMAVGGLAWWWSQRQPDPAGPAIQSTAIQVAAPEGAAISGAALSGAPGSDGAGLDGTAIGEAALVLPAAPPALPGGPSVTAPRSADATGGPADPNPQAAPAADVETGPESGEVQQTPATPSVAKPTTPGPDETIFRLAEQAAAEGGEQKLEQARDLFGQVASGYPDSRWAPLALAERARIEVAENLKVEAAGFDRKVPAALLTARELVTLYPRAPESEEGLWILATAYRDLKRFDEAVQAFVALGERFPATPYDTWWEAAQVFDKRLDDEIAAADSYDRVPPTSEHYEAAQKRLKKLRN